MFMKVDMGYHFLYCRPGPRAVFTQIFDESFNDSPGTEETKEQKIAHESIYCHVIIDYKLYFFQYFVLLNLIGGLFILLKHRK